VDRKILILKEDDYVLDVLSIETDLDYEGISKEVAKAKDKAIEDYSCEYQTSDVINNLPEEWNIESADSYEIDI
jgi:hypothetical protein